MTFAWPNKPDAPNADDASGSRPNTIAAASVICDVGQESKTMGCLGVHLALTAAEVAMLKSFKDDSGRLEYFQSELEDVYFSEHEDLIAESDKAWDALHRALSDGELSYTSGPYRQFQRIEQHSDSICPLLQLGVQQICEPRARQRDLLFRQRLCWIFVVLGQSEWPRASPNGTGVYRILGVLNPFGNPVTHV